MKIFTTNISTFSYLLLLSLAPCSSLGQGTENCSGVYNNFPAPSLGTCNEWDTNSDRGDEKSYPADFEGLTNKIKIYKCPTSKKRVIVSNGVPDHNLVIQNTSPLCEVNWVVEMPLDPDKADNGPFEVPIRGMIAMATNGVPAYGPQESDSLNAVEATESDKKGAGFWYGHAGASNAWHVHNPYMGEETVTSDQLLGYAMDGFAIYGPLDDDSVGDLDACNGLLVNGKYQYHVRNLDQVDGTLDYCNADNSPETNWNYILGCYSGSVGNTEIYDSTTYEMPSDCVLDDGSPTQAPTNGGPTSPDTRPNIIIIQPDDFQFLDEWTPPPNTPNNPSSTDTFPDNDGNGLPNIERLRLNGVQMMQAYAGAPTCGTSRFSTITGKMPSRAASVRSKADSDSDPASVTIPTTKLQDVDGQNDCSEENLAVAFRDEGYETAMMGKWHLSRINTDTYTYDSAVETVQGCGFDTVGGLYIENMVNGDDEAFNSYSDGSFSHNMEIITYEAIKFINETSKAGTPFFLYLNPTVPHGSMDIKDALENFSCRDTPDPDYEWDSDPWIKGMSEDEGCAVYRQTIIDRAVTDDDLGKIWLDDAIGALLAALEDNGELDNTIFLFQEDHGMDTKGALYEGGIRIPQFIHYPDKISPSTTFEGLVSTVDIAATMLDYAGITPPYQLDGQSWKDAIGDPTEESNWQYSRCLFFEVEQDRAVRCGCYKYINIFDTSSSATYTKGDAKGLENSAGGILFDLCAGTDQYITDNNNNREVEVYSDAELKDDFFNTLSCHLERTDPQGTPDYSECESPFPTGLTPSPSASPTPADPEDTSSPSVSPTPAEDSCQDSPLEVKTYGTCASVVEEDQCGVKKNWSHCRASCDKCNKCQDSLQKLKLSSKVTITWIKKGEEVTKKKKKLKCKNVKKALNKDTICETNSDIAISCPKTCGGC